MWEHGRFLIKKVLKKFVGSKKNLYLCTRYPENNPFTLKELIPIEDMERSLAKVVALFFNLTQTVKLS